MIRHTRKIVLLLIIAASTGNLFSQDISFYKENITMKIEAQSFFVTGLYYFKSEKYKKSTLIYPFPIDAKYGSVDSIYIFNITTNEFIKPLEVKSEYIVFSLDFSHERDLSIQITYKQILNSTRAEYILNTTLSWREPLQIANYQLIIPNDIKIESFSIHPKDSIIAGNEVIYYWEEKNYMPAKNLIFDFKVN